MRKRTTIKKAEPTEFIVDRDEVLEFLLLVDGEPWSFVLDHANSKEYTYTVVSDQRRVLMSTCAPTAGMFNAVALIRDFKRQQTKEATA